MALPGVALAERVAHVDRLHVFGPDRRGIERRVYDVAHQVGDCFALTGDISGEIALMTTEDGDRWHPATVPFRTDSGPNRVRSDEFGETLFV